MKLWILLLVFVPAIALAHGVGAHAAVKAGEVTFTMTFSDGTPAKGATVTAYRLGESRTVAAEGKTDERGAFRFKAAPGRYRIEAVDTGGHRAAVEVGVTEAGEAAPVPSGAKTGGHGHDHDHGHDHHHEASGVVIGLLVIAIFAGLLMLFQRKPEQAA